MFELPFKILVDNHVSLHALEEKDAPKLFRLVDRNRARLKQWLPWLDRTRSAADSLRFIQDSEKALRNKKRKGFCGRTKISTAATKTIFSTLCSPKIGRNFKAVR